MEGKNYYSLTTRSFTLRCSHPKWLDNTQKFYNQILLFYYNLFLDLAEKEKKNVICNESQITENDTQTEIKISQSEFASMNSQQLLRELEVRTIVGRNKEPVACPLPWSKVPLYFRRAAANAGISAGRSFLNRKEQKERAEYFHESVTYYKGTYRDFDETQITLRVWTGQDWNWLRCRLSGNQLTTGKQQRKQTDGNLLPESSLEKDDKILDKHADKQAKIEPLSPSVVIKPQGIFLHVPVREKVGNGSNAKTRMAEGVNICCVQFTNGDSIAICVSLNNDGNLTASRFLKGGRQYLNRCKRILEKIEKSKPSTAGQEKLKANQKYWLKLQNISISYSHQISREIVNFAETENCSIIVLPKYNEQYSQIVMKTVGNWSPLHLSNRIRSQLSYKSWKQGILVLETDATGISSKCAICGASIRKLGEEYLCTNGHRGSCHMNTAVNLGRKCRESFSRFKPDGKAGLS